MLPQGEKLHIVHINPFSAENIEQICILSTRAETQTVIRYEATDGADAGEEMDVKKKWSA